MLRMGCLLVPFWIDSVLLNLPILLLLMGKLMFFSFGGLCLCLHVGCHHSLSTRCMHTRRRSMVNLLRRWAVTS